MLAGGASHRPPEVEAGRHVASADMDVAAVPLTSLSHGAGCGCKLPAAGAAADRRAGCPPPPRPSCSSARPTGDDAAVSRLSDELALVQTVDFFTPVVDDPYDFGRIAAANALSDVYAMGGRPADRAQPRGLARSSSSAPTRWARSCAAAPTSPRAAGAAVVGGHSIDDPEPKYGLAVTGVVHPDARLTNAGGARRRRAGADQAARRGRGGRPRASAGSADDGCSRARSTTMAALNADAAAAAARRGRDAP